MLLSGALRDRLCFSCKLCQPFAVALTASFSCLCYLLLSPVTALLKFAPGSHGKTSICW